MIRMRACIRLLALICCLFWMAVGTADAHSLGVDKGNLIDHGDNQYSLSSIVPVRLQPAITTPILPERCRIEGSPRGERGVYEVRFNFSCDTPLVGDDVLILPWSREGVLLTVSWQGQEPVSRLASREGKTIHVYLADYLVGSGSFLRAAKRYFILGFEHILEGFDHLLFVLALMLVVRGSWRLVKSITAFTVAHSITLGLATFGFVNLPPAPVEATIAMSIVFLCSELIYFKRGKTSLTFSKPWLVAFGFGLLHGLGFAGALSEIGLPPGEIPVALLFFNLGVEAGQLLFVGVVLASFGILYALLRGGHRKLLVRGEWLLIYSIGTIATYWTIERVIAVVT